jgi:parallel beta-helix repeat protein
MRTISGIMLMLLLVSMLPLAFNIRQVRSDWTWTETIYIQADGSIYPSTAPISSTDNVTYTLTDNIIGEVPSGYSVIIVERDNITVDGSGYTLQGTGAEIGIDLSNRTNVTIKNMIVEAFYECIYLVYSSNSTIFGNNIATTGYAIYLEFSSSNRISGNDIANGEGIYLNYSSHNTISGNNIADNGEGIYLYSSSNNNVSENNIRNNWFGVLLDSSSGNSIFGNHITYNGYGIFIDFSSGNSISGNSIMTNSGYGIFIDSSLGNSIFHNNFVGNSVQVYSSSDSVNIWDNGYPSGGNYWSNYAGADADHDGIGDIPYIIDANNTDHYPLALLWGTGDINRDGKVTLTDLVLLAMAYGSRPGDLKWNPNADINNNGTVDLPDLVLLAKCYGKTYT